MSNNRLLWLIPLTLLLLASPVSCAAGEDDVSAAVNSALSYLASCQNTDGGFIEPNMLNSSIGSTWFAVTAITAAGQNPADWKTGVNSPRDYWNTLNDETDGTAEMAKTITYLVQFGLDPHKYNGHDYVADLKSKIKSTGQAGDFIYTTYWAVFALAAAGENPGSSVAWLKTQQQENGGFGWADGSEADSDDTAAVIMALIAGGVSPDDPAITKALAFLRSIQEPTGGFNYGYYSESNLASTAWVIQALCAAGIDPASVTSSGRSPVDYLLSLQQADGSFKYTAYTTDSPVSMTARAVAALTGKPYPVFAGQTGYHLHSSAQTAVPTRAATPAAEETTVAAEWTPITVTDDYGTTVRIQTEPQRIVSLAPANTEILFALGLGDKVVGVTEYCTYPEEAKSKTIIGGYSTVNIERVISQKPDLIVAYYGNGAETIQYLRTLGYTVICLNSDSIAGTLADIRLVGKVTGADAEAEALVSSMQTRLSAVKNTLAGVSDKPTIIHCMWTDPLWVSGNRTFQDEMITAAGGTNAAAVVDGWGILTIEKFLTINPEIIIVDSGMGMGAGGTDILKDSFFTDPRLKTLSAVKNGKVYVVNADIIDRGGPRIVDGVEMLASILHPEIFGEYAPKSTASTSPGFALPLILAGIAAGYLIMQVRRK
ncbi:MAG: helical backbone metal receptor [Methanocorpusculum sp.]|nr:helical backbone metal receptor [Methanocorpusculum sp.]